MISLVAAVIGYLVGGLPTSDWLAQRIGLDLRTAGSGNPGANNALRVGGPRLGATILGVDVAKGVGCAALGAWMAGDAGTALAGIGAVLGQILNPYRRLRGGQGLAVATGSFLYALAVPALAGLFVVAVGTRVLGRTAPASLAALVAVTAVAAVGPFAPWGIESRAWAVALAGGAAGVIAPKQVTRLTRPDRPPRSRRA